MGDYKYIAIQETIPVNKSRKTKVWDVINRVHGVYIGIIKWYGAWRQYCFFTQGGIILSAGCMPDIEGFVKEQMDERKNNGTKA